MLKYPTISYSSIIVWRMELQSIEQGYYLLPFSQPYWPAIKADLLTIQSSHDLQKIVSLLLKFHHLTRGTQIKKFDQLFKVPRAAAISTFNHMASFILEHQQYYTQNPRRIPLFTQHITSFHTFSKRDVALLMCTICLCISTNAKKMNDKFKTKLTTQTDCGGVYGFYKRKIPFLLKYFDTVFEELGRGDNNEMTISRLKLPSLRKGDVMKIEDPMLEIEVERDENSLDGWSGETRVKVDFANRFIGGGTLNRGCVQEQLMFLNHTQACISTLLCDPMLDNEAIGLHGFKKYFKNTGYSTTSEFDGLQKFQYTLDEKNHFNDYIIAIDALVKQPNQYSCESILREINKSRSGFSLFPTEFRISTGNWGCGVFKGDVQLKFIIQWISTSIVERRIVYYPYGNKRLAGVGKVIEVIKGQPVSRVFKALLDYDPSLKTPVFDYLIKSLPLP